jgi:hypothetical protein
MNDGNSSSRCRMSCGSSATVRAPPLRLLGTENQVCHLLFGSGLPATVRQLKDWMALWKGRMLQRRARTGPPTRKRRSRGGHSARCAIDSDDADDADAGGNDLGDFVVGCIDAHADVQVDDDDEDDSGGEAGLCNAMFVVGPSGICCRYCVLTCRGRKKRSSCSVCAGTIFLHTGSKSWRSEKQQACKFYKIK